MCEGRALFLLLAPDASCLGLSRAIPTLGWLVKPSCASPFLAIFIPKSAMAHSAHFTASLTGVQQLTCLFLVGTPFPPSVTSAPMERDPVQTAVAAANAKIESIRWCGPCGTIQVLNFIANNGQYLAAPWEERGRWLLGVGSLPSRPMSPQGVLEVPRTPCWLL